MNRPTSFTTSICSLALVSLLWLSSLAPALAAPVTDTFPLTVTGTERCRGDLKFFEPIHVKIHDGKTLTLTRDVLNTSDPTDIQATINTNGDNATIDAMTLNGRALFANKAGSTRQLVLSGRDPGNPDHFMTLRGTATFDKAGNLTKVTGTYVYQILSDSGGMPNSDCFGSGTFGTGKKPRFDLATLEAYVKASNTDGAENFGTSVALDGDTLAVGAFREASAATGVDPGSISGDQNDNSALGTGAVYVFTRTGGIWRQQAYVKASNKGAGQFGWSVALAGDTLAVGAPFESGIAPGSGAVYVFTRTGGVWREQAKVKASNTGQSDHFGWSVALAGDTLAVGAESEGSNATGVDPGSISGSQADNHAPGSGAVYVFTRKDGIWSQQAYVKASNTDVADHFGSSVALAGDTLAVGAYQEASLATGVDPGSISGSQADNSANINGAGAVYVFTRTLEGEVWVWSQQAYVKASNTGVADHFGSSVALAGDTLAVGAYFEASSATGVNNPNQGDSSAGFQSGAAYVFTRTGGVWSQQAYVKASNTDSGDEFGWSVALAGDTLAVGAVTESSIARGVNGDQADHGLAGLSSGAVYVFTRTGKVWSQQAYVKASNTGAFDRFGYSVALAGDILAAGAITESSNAKGVNGNQNNDKASGSGAAYVYRAH